VDSSFGTNGKVSTDFSQTGEDDFVTTLIIQPDEKILIFGYYGFSSIKSIVARYTADGMLDPSFAGDGILKINIPNFYPGDLALQADGKILIGGETEEADFVVKRINENGSPDLTFGDNGLASVNVSSTYSDLFKLLIQDDGKILAAGNSENDFTIVRFDTQGLLDITFGENGITSALAVDSNDKPRSAILQPDGKILMTGHTQKYPDYDEIILIRFTNEGKVDSSFGNYGVIATLINCDESHARCLALDGNYIYAGGGRGNPTGESCLIRYLNGCDIPKGLEVVNITPTEVALNWDNATGAGSYKLRFKVSGSGTWQKASALVSKKKIKELLAATKYIVQVRSNCNAEISSDWSEKLKFITPPARLAGELLPSNTLQVYPNPLSDEAVVQFSITQNSILEISLFDLQGRKIKTITEGNFEAGSHQLNFSPEDLPQGIYLLQLSTWIPSEKSYSTLQSLKLIVQ
jgi:uncharacterized delta-60 repeat protein